MTCKIVFDPLEIAPKQLVEAVAAIDAKLKCEFQNHRETRGGTLAKTAKVAS